VSCAPPRLHVDPPLEMEVGGLESAGDRELHELDLLVNSERKKKQYGRSRKGMINLSLPFQHQTNNWGEVYQKCSVCR
jgi:hypothetical protein